MKALGTLGPIVLRAINEVTGRQRLSAELRFFDW
jgi:hypothetical protein